MLARAHKKFQRGRHSEIYLLILKKQDKTKVELPLDMVSISASSCRTNVGGTCEAGWSGLERVAIRVVGSSSSPRSDGQSPAA